MSERPILFSGAMVRAILEGRKAQTRRILRRERQYGPFAFDDPRVARYCPYGQPGDRLWVRETWHLWGPPEHQTLAFRADCADAENYTWRPSIFMPRWASRITLEITDVRVERVQAISHVDAIAEGAIDAELGAGDLISGSYAVTNYAVLWDGINAKRGYSWSSNPWVWVLTFTRVQP